MLLNCKSVSAEQEQAANTSFRSLVTLHIRITLLSDVVATAGYAHGRAAIGLLQTLMVNASPKIVSDLGALHRASIWENISLKAGLESKGIDVPHTPNDSPREGSPDSSSNAGLTTSTATATANGMPPEHPTSETSPRTVDSSQQDGPREHNAQALKHLTHGLPSSLSPFFQGNSSQCRRRGHVLLICATGQLSSKCFMHGATRTALRRSKS
jgi:E3 ubiquitin-protein ligase HUWE1